MRIALIAATSIYAQGMKDESGGQWEPEEMYDDASTLSEFAGRQCYESWKRPNPKTATNAGYIGHIIDEMHTSVLEHGSVSFRVSGVSRALTHQLIRHRHGSYSQLSERFVPVKRSEGDEHLYVLHPFWAEDPEAQGRMSSMWERAVDDYDWLYARALTRCLADSIPPFKARKMAAEAARMVLPNMTPTALVVTGNHLYWRHFLDKRGGVAADAEIRQMAVMVYGMLVDLDPNLYQDFALFDRAITDDGKVTVRTVERVS